MASQGEHVPHLVNEDQHDEADRELPAPQQAVGGDRHQRAARGRQHLYFGRQQEQCLELREQRDDRSAGRAELLAYPGSPRLAERFAGGRAAGRRRRHGWRFECPA